MKTTLGERERGNVSGEAPTETDETHAYIH